MDYGISIYDIKNLESPVLISNYFTGGGSYMRFLTRDPNVMILIAGVMGVRILNLTNSSAVKRIAYI